MTENNDIKPVRPEIASKRGALRNKGGGVLFSSTITIINSLGLVLLFFWFFNTSGNQQEAGQNFIERISSLEESSSENQKVIDELSQNIDAELKFVNKEIRKLWDLSNKRNRKNITANLNSIEEIQNKLTEFAKIDETLTAKQRALSLELAKLNKILEKINLGLENNNLASSYDTNQIDLGEIEDSINSFDAYRLQVNQSIIDIREKLTNLELKILDAQNE
tara:strand:+ start:630 stop:1292 length:663 start_codon:yes stop_codon:yes gene_type:complete